MANRKCNLECVEGKDEDEVVEFVGPVKIILVDRSKPSYKSKVCYAAVIVLAQMTMAATCIIVILYTFTYKKENYLRGLHVFLCTFGFQLLLPIGVLTMNSLNGAAAPMSPQDRKIEHGIVQIFGLMTTSAGSVASYFAKYPTFITEHCVLGMIANGCGLLNAIVGIVLYIFFKEYKDNESIYKRISKRLFRVIHQALGIMTISFSCLCFLDGIIDNSFIEWLPLKEMLYLLEIFCVFYTSIVIYKPICFFKNQIKF